MLASKKENTKYNIVYCWPLFWIFRWRPENDSIYLLNTNNQRWARFILAWFAAPARCLLRLWAGNVADVGSSPQKRELAQLSVADSSCLRPVKTMRAKNLPGAGIWWACLPNTARLVPTHIHKRERFEFLFDHKSYFLHRYSEKELIHSIHVEPRLPLLLYSSGLFLSWAIFRIFGV